MKNTGIYKVKNLINGRCYYGSSLNLDNRKRNHFSLLKSNKHYNSFMQAEYNQFGKNNFVFGIVIYCDKHDLHFYEQRFLNRYFDNQVNCYNSGKNALNAMTGKSQSEETRKKISDSLKGHEVLPRTRKLIGKANRKKK